MTEKPKNNQSVSIVLLLTIAGLTLAALGVIFFLSVFDPCGEAGCDGPGPARATPSDFTGITAIEPAQDVADFTLTDQNGESVSLSELRGKPTLIFFGFTHCPDLCPTTLIEYRKIYETVGKDQVNFVFVSVDGSRDTPDVLKQYFETSRVPYVIGLTGDLDVVLKAGAPFNLVAEHGPMYESGIYDVTHTSSIFILNREGQLVAKYAYGTLLDVMIEDVRTRL